MLKKRRWKFPKTLLRFWLFYGILAVALIAVIGVPMYCGFYSVLSADTYDSTAGVLKTLSQTMDTHMQEMDRITVQLSQNSKLIPYFLGMPGMYSYEAQQELDKVRRSNDFIYDVAVYFTSESMHNKAGRFYAASGEYAPDAYFDYIYRYESWNAELFQKQVPSMTRPQVRPMEKIWVHRSYPDQFITYICPLISNMQPNTRGIVMFLVSKSKMDAMLGHSVLNDHGLTCISDADGNVVYAADNTGAELGAREIGAAAAQAGPSGGSPMQNVTVGGGAYARIATQSGYNHWRYLCLLPKDFLLHKVYANLEIILYTLLMALVLGVVISYLLSVKSYRPIRQLSGKLMVLAGDSCRDDDFKLISRSVDELVQSNATLMTRLSSQQSIVRMQVLQNLLFNRFDAVQDIEKLILAADIEFPHGEFAVMAFSIENYRAFSAAHDNSMQELLRFGMLNAMEELAQRNGCRGYGVDLPGERLTVLLVNLDAQGRGDEPFETIGRGMTDFFETKFNVSLSVGVGGTCGAVGSIPESFRQAVEAAGERFVSSHERIIFHQRLASPGSAPWHPHEQERRLLDAVRQGDSMAAENAAGAVVSGVLQRGLGAAAARSVLSAVANAVNKLLCDIRIAVDWDMKTVLLCRQDTIWEWQEDMNEVLAEACQKVSLIKESNNSLLKEQLIQYVNAHYASADISLQSLAAHFKLSGSYITRFFKDRTGVSLMHYLDQVRMEHAMGMLSDTLLPLNEIVARCGYVDETNFIRKFRGICGQTPIQYRRSVQLQRRREEGADAGRSGQNQ